MHTNARRTADQLADRLTDDGFICAARDPNSTRHVQDNTRFGGHERWGKVLPELGS
jgi:hypothetical protein